MGKRKSRRSPPPPEPEPIVVPESRASARTQLILCLLVAAGLIVVIWAVPRRTGDLYVGYAGGRDVLDGKIGAGPDDWCFNTIKQKRLWFNQNWGTHLVYYLVWTRGGEAGYLILKMAFLVVAATFMTLGARQRGARWPISVLVAGAMIAAGHAYIDLRPNLTTLTFSPVMLWLIYRTRGRPHRIWWATAFLILWANMHGGFVLGLAMLGLWAGCSGVEAMVREGVKPAFARLWPLLAGFGAAVVGAGVITPFGLKNLTHFLEVSDPAWRNVQEWHSVWRHKTGYGTTKEFFVIVTLFALLAAVRVAWPRERKRGHRPAPDRAPVGPVIFDAVLACMVLYMGFKARRFVTLSNMTVAAMFAALLDWPLRKLRRQWPVPALAGGLAVLVLAPWSLPRASRERMSPESARYASSLALKTWQNYRPGNPFRSPRLKSVYDKMIFNNAYGHGAAEFLNKNKIAGRAMHEWRWEGFLHWRCPQLQLYVGGRAQQVHSLHDYKLNGRIWGGAPEAVRAMDNLGVDFLIGPLEWGSQVILDRVQLRYLLPDRRRRRGVAPPPIPKGEQPRWVPIYYDGDSFILANSRRPAAAQWIRRAAEGTLWYPDQAIGAWSRAMCLSAGHFGPDYRRVFEALKTAVMRRPFLHFYIQMIRFVPRIVSEAEMRRFLEQELQRLARQKQRGYAGTQLLAARRLVARNLELFYRREVSAHRAQNQLAEANAAAAKMRQVGEVAAEIEKELDALGRKWAL